MTKKLIQPTRIFWAAKAASAAIALAKRCLCKERSGNSDTCSHTPQAGQPHSRNTFGITGYQVFIL